MLDYQKIYENTRYELGNYKSRITDKHLNSRLSDGKNDIILASAKAQLTEDYMELTFITDSTTGEGIPRTVAVGPKYNYNNEYTLVLRFYKVADILPPNLKTMKKEDREPLIKQVIDTCDIRFHSDDPSYQFQGVWEQLSKLGLSIYKFKKGEKGKDIWKNRHQAAGAGDIWLTKHLCQLLDELDSFLPEIAKVIKTRGTKPATRKRYINPIIEEKPTNSIEGENNGL
jgi:hypothetical protein